MVLQVVFVLAVCFTLVLLINTICSVLAPMEVWSCPGELPIQHHSSAVQESS